MASLELVTSKNNNFKEKYPEFIKKIKSRKLIEVDPKLFRPYEKTEQNLVADNNKLRMTGWKPLYSWDALVDDMITNC